MGDGGGARVELDGVDAESEAAAEAVAEAHELGAAAARQVREQLLELDQLDHQLHAGVELGQDVEQRDGRAAGELGDLVDAGHRPGEHVDDRVERLQRVLHLAVAGVEQVVHALGVELQLVVGDVGGVAGLPVPLEVQRPEDVEEADLGGEALEEQVEHTGAGEVGAGGQQAVVQRGQEDPPVLVGRTVGGAGARRHLHGEGGVELARRVGAGGGGLVDQHRRQVADQGVQAAAFALGG